MFTAIAAFALCSAMRAEPVNLTRTYKEGQVATYKVTADIDQAGQALTLSASIKYTVKKVLAKGADVELNATTVDTTMGGSAGPDLGSPGVQTYTADAQGLLKGVQFRQIESLYAILGLCNCLPGKAISAGDEFVVKWESEGYALTGKGTFVGMKEVDGKSLAVIKLKLEVTPTSESPANIDVTSLVSPDSGALVSSEGTVTSDNFSAKIKVAIQK